MPILISSLKARKKYEEGHQPYGKQGSHSSTFMKIQQQDKAQYPANTGTLPPRPLDGLRGENGGKKYSAFPSAQVIFSR